ncbi:MAG TPA: hypothetical protein VFQ22_01290, partial [Longimicrobiales bacterium]|nr:hypothetical protein [Longimicrobiales bacterium]
AARLPAESVEELRWALGDVSSRVLDAQPAMAPLVHLVRDVMAAVERAGSVEDARAAAREAAAGFRAGLETRAEAVAERAAAILPAHGRIATISSSSTVRAALVRAGPRSGPGERRSVLCFESRPMNEGQSLATALAPAGFDVTYAVDAAAPSLIPGCAMVLLGADSIGDGGVANKIGSLGMALSAARAGVPVYVLSDETKILPRGFPQRVDEDRPAEEVWKAPVRVGVWNRYFELVPLELVTGVVTESAVLDAAELERFRDGIELPAALRKWSEGGRDRER